MAQDMIKKDALGRFLPKKEANDRDREIAALVMGGASPADIAAVLGLTEMHIFNALSSPHVQMAIFEAQRGVIRRAATKAIKVIERYATVDATTEGGKKIQLEAAKTLVSMAGHSAQGAAQAAGGRSKGIGEMSLEEIEQALQDAKTARSDQAQVIDVAPDNAQGSAQQDGQDVDIYG